jgi:hypothetical protein
MNLLCKTWLLVSLSAAAVQPLLLAQSPAPSHTLGCEESHRILTPRNPRLAADGRILAGQAIVQARLTLDESTTVRIVEYPRAGGKGLDSYNSTIIIQRGQEQKRYQMGRLMKDGSLLRLVEVTCVCTSSDQGSFFLAFETGSSEGFAVIRYSPETVDVLAFPWAEQGRIVVNRATPNQVELWSATGSAGRFDCGACEKYYSLQDCQVGQQNVECKLRPGPRKILLPGKFEGARIEIR